MEIVTTPRNLRITPLDNEELTDLRTNKWQLYTAPNPVPLKVQGHEFRFRPGLTLTPFANALPCNAHCRFCSEELQRHGQHSLTAKRYIQDYDRYFDALSHVLLSLRSLPIGLSLSGLEPTAEPQWLLRLVQVLRDLQPQFQFDEKVLYTNGTGLYRHPHLVEALQSVSFDRIELSRCHYDEEINQKVMYFNRNEPVWRNQHYEDLIRTLQGRLFVKNSCILTRTGIHDLDSMETYLNWATDLGVREVVFRELSRLDDSYIPNATSQWIQQNRIPIEPLIAQIAPSRSNTRNGWRYLGSTLGYYYYNEHYLYRGQTEVIVETSSYPALMEAHTSPCIHKLVFHSNGNLCGDWNPDAQVLGNFF